MVAKTFDSENQVTIYELKPEFQRLLRPLCRSLAKAGVTANQVTISALLLSIALGICLTLMPGHRWALLALPVVLFVRMALNAIDGMLAREHDMKSSLGAVLNELSDVISDAVLYLPLALVPGVNPLLIVSLVVVGIIGEMTGVIAVQIGAERRYDGPFGKSDRAFVFGFMGLLLGFGIELDPWISWVLSGFLVLGIITIINRASKALKEVAVS